MFLLENLDNLTLELIEFLLEQGADPALRGWMGLNAIDKARQRADAEKNEVLALLNKKRKQKFAVD